MIAKKLSKIFIVLAIAAQILVLAYMAGKRELIIAKGTEIYIRSAPIDPRDPFRGDFVRLRYDINAIHQNQTKANDFPENKIPAGTTVYAVLQENENSIYSLDQLTTQRPENGLYIKGRASNDWRFRQNVSLQHTTVKYGIEQYYVQQGKGIEMEDRLGSRNGLQVPLEMRIALGSDGTPVIKGHRWSSLGIQLEFIRPATTRRNENEALVSPVIKISLKNVSDQNLTLFNPGDNCAFGLYWASGDASGTRADEACKINPANENDFIVLEPNAEYSTELDLSLARWHVQQDGKILEVGALTSWQNFRVIYTAPKREAVKDYTGQYPFWYGDLPSSRFSASGRID